MLREEEIIYQDLLRESPTSTLGTGPAPVLTMESESDPELISIAALVEAANARSDLVNYYESEGNNNHGSGNSQSSHQEGSDPASEPRNPVPVDTL